MSTSASRDGGLSPPVAIAAAGPTRVSRVLDSEFLIMGLRFYAAVLLFFAGTKFWW
jgi:hypothetical protein